MTDTAREAMNKRWNESGSFSLNNLALRCKSLDKCEKTTHEHKINNKLNKSHLIVRGGSDNSFDIV